jgi:cytochrome o ubiquinol oxidase subunit 3
MTAIVKDREFAHADHSDAGKTPLGFWIYLMSDCVLFASIFAGFVVLRDNLNGGPAGRELFDLSFVAVETALLLISSLTYGMAMIAANAGNLRTVFVWLALTFLCGVGFVSMEVHEFSKLIAEGAGPDRSGFLSAFFTLVGTHGLHVTSGLVWMGVMFIQLALRGLTAVNRTRLLLLSLFWHFLDIVWIGVFSIVYLMGAA